MHLNTLLCFIQLILTKSNHLHEYSNLQKRMRLEGLNKKENKNSGYSSSDVEVNGNSDYDSNPGKEFIGQLMGKKKKKIRPKHKHNLVEESTNFIPHYSSKEEISDSIDNILVKKQLTNELNELDKKEKIKRKIIKILKILMIQTIYQCLKMIVKLNQKIQRRTN